MGQRARPKATKSYYIDYSEQRVKLNFNVLYIKNFFFFFKLVQKGKFWTNGLKFSTINGLRSKIRQKFTCLSILSIFDSSSKHKLPT